MNVSPHVDSVLKQIREYPDSAYARYCYAIGLHLERGGGTVADITGQPDGTVVVKGLMGGETVYTLEEISDFKDGGGTPYREPG